MRLKSQQALNAKRISEDVFGGEVAEATIRARISEVKANLPLFTDLVILSLSDKRLEDLRGPQAKENLKKEFLAQMNQALGSPKVTRIYFDEFLFQ